VGAAATKSTILGALILVTAQSFVDYEIAHPFWVVGCLVLTAVTFSLFGFILGIWADGFEKLQVVPMMIVTPLTFLGGAFAPSTCSRRFGRTSPYSSRSSI
jgi:ABC-2 type transport system permease protein